MMIAAPALADTGQTPRGIADYMTARAADAAGRTDIATPAYARALAATPGDTTVAARSYREAMESGDLALAARAAQALQGSPQAPGDLALFPLAQAAAQGDATAADRAIAGLVDTPLGVLVPALRGWSAFARGADPRPALAAAATLKDPIAQRLAVETGALLQIARGDTDAGLATIRAMQQTGAPIDLRLAAAQLLFARGQREPARALLAGDDPVLAAFRRGVAAEPTLAFGVSRLLARVAGDLAGQGPSVLAVALARNALIADPADDRARLLLASALAAEGMTDGALRQLAAVTPKSPFAPSAAAARIDVLTAADRDDEALALAAMRAKARDATAGDWQRYADRLLAAGRYAEAARWYRRVIDDGGAAGEWASWMQYGGALEQAGDWPGARAALQKAVALAPSEPLALNYLGYSLADHGEDRPGAIRLLERAQALKPDDSSIADSLGWAYHLAGQNARALPLIARAAQAQPDNAEIGEHLGDLYWAMGRRYEARYAWRAAAVVADGRDGARLAEKLVNGLPNG
ncbi:MULTISPECIES: tetratricopeptide repeat protein [unclassified Sphingomonas]|jgi:Flp pilus assembly protein TadD|uniref:tetratricopeptide repeat protein n=1 Tax=unclassified Sphingomonas TaxID=196159 RepID=UPI001E41010D|nr:MULTISPECIES: tetratricopeptide repeat protein [unclassified Sphingomonas]